MKILIAGDFVPSNRIKAQVESGCFNFLSEVRPIINSVDYAIVNLECPIVLRDAKPIDKTGPNIRAHEKLLECILDNGFKCVTLANNHFRDYGQIGVEDTLNSCQSYGIDSVGGGRTLQEAEKILYKNIDGKRLAIINVCESEWSIASEDYGGAAPLNPVRNFYAIQEARKQADSLIVIVHGGVEHYQYPTPRMIETYRFFIDAGADAVINHHQHCFSGYEVYNRKPIIYGLGNFCFDQKDQKECIAWNEGYMLVLQINDDCVKFEVIPYTQCVNNPNVSLLTSDETIEFNKKIADINNTIASQDLILKEFDNLLNDIADYRLSELEPFDNKYIRALQRRGILKSFLSNRTLRNLNNIISCDSHREIILRLLHKLLIRNASK